MNIISKKSGQGKTHDLIILSNETRMPILVATKTMARNILEDSIRMDLDIPSPISLNEFDKYKNKDGILIDEIDMLLYQMLGVKVHTLTNTIK